jgi:hypothetical protein
MTEWFCAEVSKTWLLNEWQFQLFEFHTNAENSRLGTKSCKPADVFLGSWDDCEPGISGVSVMYVWAGSQPITVSESADAGVAFKKDNAKAGRDGDNGVGG